MEYGFSESNKIRHAQHLEISKQYYQDQNNKTSLWPSQGLEILNSVSADIGLKLSENEIKNIMWNFDGSQISVNPVTGKVKWE